MGKYVALMNMNGTRDEFSLQTLFELDNHAYHIKKAAFSPSGDYFAFLAYYESKPRIYLIHLLNRAHISEHKTYIVDPEFSSVISQNAIRDINLFERDEEVILLLLLDTGEVMTYSLGSFGNQGSILYDLIFGEDFNFTMSIIIIGILVLVLMFKFGGL